MSQLDLGPGAERLIELLDGVSDVDLTKPTPLPLYPLDALIAHVGGLAMAFTAAAKKERSDLVEHAPSGERPPLPADWRTRIPRDLTALVEAWRDPAASTGMTRIAGQDAPAEMVALTVADELVVHGWDVARALGQDYDADPQLIEAAKSFLTAFSSPDAPAGDDVPFGPSRPAPVNAAPIEEVVALAGRDVNWSPAG